MSLIEAIRYTEILMGLAFMQQSIEHLRSFRNEQLIFLARLILSLLLVAGIQTSWVTGLLLLSALAMLHRFQGPYNGGSDRMGLLVLCCLLLSDIAPTQYWQEVAFGYLAIQLVLSYFISGWVKIINPDWRSGQALTDVFQFSSYPVSESLRSLATYPRVMFVSSWYVMLFEILFPLALLNQYSLIIMLIVTASFHFANACLFGLNRFFWIWLSAYPSIIWFQQRLFVTM
ncbi:MAG: HTTM domain-containing protein [Gammaproteobacteria bacterium]|nr:HTTM domain-containing protein [Gammaproteobacteria bacterium]